MNKFKCWFPNSINKHQAMNIITALNAAHAAERFAERYGDRHIQDFGAVKICVLSDECCDHQVFSVTCETIKEYSSELITTTK